MTRPNTFSYDFAIDVLSSTYLLMFVHTVMYSFKVLHSKSLLTDFFKTSCKREWFIKQAQINGHQTDA